MERWSRWLSYVGNSVSQKINVVKNGDNLYIYVPSKTTPNLYLMHAYVKLVDAPSNINTWLYDRCAIYTRTNGVYTLKFSPSPGNSDNEGVLYVQGETDFIGGKHGYDIMESLDVIIDGKQIDMATNFDLECSFIRIANKSRVLHDGTTDLPQNKAFTRYKIHTWTLDSFTLEGKWVAEAQTTVTTSKLCDFSIDKVNNGVNVIKWGRNDVDYIKTDVSAAFVETPRVNGVRKQEMWSQDANFYIGLSCEWDIAKYPNSYGNIEELGGTRAKIYFDLTGAYTFAAGEAIRYKNTYEFSF